MKKAAATTRTGANGKNVGNVDDYLASQPKAIRDALEQLRTVIRSVVPGAEEVISYQIPTFKQQGALVGYAAFTKHCSFFVMSPPLMEKFAKELAPFEVAKATIHFAPDRPLPAALVKKIVKARVKENQARKAK